MCDILEHWPILKHPKGYELIEIDYSFLKVSCVEEVNEERWFSFYTNLLNVCPVKSDDDLAVSYKKLLSLDNITNGKKDLLSVANRYRRAAILSLYSYVIFIFLFQLPADTVVIQERRKKVIKDLGLTLQPFIIVVGPQISDIDSAYVCVDKILYKVPSVLTALNICFKTFHVFNAIYPPESEHLWLLLQRILFMFSTKWDKMAPYVMEIITDMSNTDKENSV
ncbi:uncharacterized protein [Cardiocondyla obscurior]|uniref:uncharacterized protein n=1 Tax=Cardiocondyla obscurior TaxID=286306 RepID=UPI003965794C